MSEEIQETKQPSQQFQQRDEQRNLERRLRLIENPYSMVILTSNSVVPNGIVNAIMNLDRSINNLIRETGRIPVAVVKEKMKEAEALSESLWEQVKSVVPSLFDFDPKRWMEINEPPEQKKLLANRQNARVFIRRTEYGAELMMGFKVMGRKRIEYASTGNIDMLDKMAKIFNSFSEKINELNDSITEILGGGSNAKRNNNSSNKE